MALREKKSRVTQRAEGNRREASRHFQILRSESEDIPGRAMECYRERDAHKILRIQRKREREKRSCPMRMFK